MSLSEEEDTLMVVVDTPIPWLNVTLCPECTSKVHQQELSVSSDGARVMNISPSSNRQEIAPSISIAGDIRIPLYVTILILSVVGNGLIIITLAQNKRMRTVTNVLLLNLAISDLLLSVFCMPFTLVGALLRDFIFGAAMCVLIPFFQAVSISVSAWTLVTVSLERYFAICQPLRSRRWQTLSHIYKMIAVIWIVSILWMSPIACISKLLPVNNTGKHKCREMWPSIHYERGFAIFLDIILLLLPGVIMAMAYWLISRTLYKGIQQEMENKNHEMKMTLMKKECHQQFFNKRYCNGEITWGGQSKVKGWQSEKSALHKENPNPCHNNKNTDGTAGSSNNGSQNTTATTAKPFKRIIRRTNLDKTLAAKKRVIRMLLVVVMEFFICWTPLFVLNTWVLFRSSDIYNGLGYTGISLIQLLAFVSSCCNPITYCFMHKKFKQSFLTVFRCRRKRRSPFGRDVSGNDSSFYFSWQSTLRTEIQYSDKEDEICRHMRLLAPNEHSSV